MPWSRAPTSRRSCFGHRSATSRVAIAWCRSRTWWNVWNGEHAVPDDWAVLTFDDGYRNNLTCARQILREEGNLPMSVFVVTDFLGTPTTFWTSRLLMATLYGRYGSLRVPAAEAGGRPFREDEARASEPLLALASPAQGTRRARPGGGAGGVLRTVRLGRDRRDPTPASRASTGSRGTRPASSTVMVWMSEAIRARTPTCARSSTASGCGTRSSAAASASRRSWVLHPPTSPIPTGLRPISATSRRPCCARPATAAESRRCRARSGERDNPYELRRLTNCVGTMPRFRMANARGGPRRATA